MEWATDGRGRFPAEEFFQSLSKGEQAQMLALFQRLADEWRIVNREHFKSLGGGLWEFKKFQLRFLGGYRSGYRFLTAHGLRKKKDKHSPVDIETVRRILRENDEAEEREQ